MATKKTAKKKTATKKAAKKRTARRVGGSASSTKKKTGKTGAKASGGSAAKQAKKKPATKKAAALPQGRGADQAGAMPAIPEAAKEEVQEARLPALLSVAWYESGEDAVAKALRRYELTAKQALWVVYYLTEAAGNATEAARLAGYSSRHQQTGSDLKHHAAVQAAKAEVAPLLAADGRLLNQVLARGVVEAMAPPVLIERRYVTLKSEDGESVKKEILEYRADPDWRLRAQFAKDLAALGEGKSLDQSAPVVVVNYSEGDPTSFEGYTPSKRKRRGLDDSGGAEGGE